MFNTSYSIFVSFEQVSNLLLYLIINTYVTTFCGFKKTIQIVYLLVFIMTKILFGVSEIVYELI